MKKYWEEPVCGIYRISHRDSDKSYIGQSRDIFKRWKEHSNFSKKKLSYISSALKLHSLQSFVWEVIEECSPEELNSREIYWISYFNSLSPSGYNLTSGGGQRITVSEEFRARISEAVKASMTEEVRAKISEAKKGIKRGPHSEETKSKLSNLCSGWSHSDEAKKIISQSSKERESNFVKVSCPHCGKTGQKVVMARWHFDNCKSKPPSDSFRDPQ